MGWKIASLSTPEQIDERPMIELNAGEGYLGSCA